LADPGDPGEQSVAEAWNPFLRHFAATRTDARTELIPISAFTVGHDDASDRQKSAEGVEVPAVRRTKRFPSRDENSRNTQARRAPSAAGDCLFILPFSRPNPVHDTLSAQLVRRCGRGHQPQLETRSPESMAMPLTVATVDAIRERLAAIPEKDGTERKVTRLEAITRMTEEILGLRKRGYSWKEVAELVSNEGCRVTVGSLKTVLWKRGATSRAKARSSTKVAGPRRPRHLESRPTGTVDRPETTMGVNGAELRSSKMPREPGTFVPREDTKDI
jgi:hypothetical protein